MAGNLALLLNGIGIAVTFTILLVIANTMSIAVRERRTEIGVLKTLGFTSAQVMGLVVAESLLIARPRRRPRASPGAAGIMWVLTHAPGIKDALAGIGLSELSLQPPGGRRSASASRSSWASRPASSRRSAPTARASPTC